MGFMMDLDPLIVRPRGSLAGLPWACLFALTQGLALMGRVGEQPAKPRSGVRASLAALRA